MLLNFPLLYFSREAPADGNKDLRQTSGLEFCFKYSVGITLGYVLCLICHSGDLNREKYSSSCLVLLSVDTDKRLTSMFKVKTISDLLWKQLQILLVLIGYYWNERKIKWKVLCLSQREFIEIWQRIKQVIKFLWNSCKMLVASTYFPV